MTTIDVLNTAAKAKNDIIRLTALQKNDALTAMANALLLHKENIIEQNKVDMQSARDNGINEVMQDRLCLTEARIEAMAKGINDVVALDDPIGEVLESFKRENGLKISKIRVPLGVIAIIFESRPNVASDAAALCLKSGNVCVLRGGKEAFNSIKAIVSALKEGLKSAGFSENLVNMVPETSREGASTLMTANGLVDLLIPRGGAGLISACVNNATVPCIETGTGICHIYVDKSANQEKALNIIKNAKTSRPSVCNAAEVCLVHKDIAAEFLPKLKHFIPEIELRLDAASIKIVDGTPAGINDFDTEFLDYILAVKIVNDVNAAIEHISLHSTKHSDAIITEDQCAAKMFTTAVDSAAVYVNASTRFTDGGEFGLGCEIGIATQKLHARGPMGLKEMTTYKYIIEGDGQIR